MAKVSCIVACYNAAKTLDAAVRSALAQVDVEVEVIVSDDCSSDTSRDVAKALAAEDPRVKLIMQERRGGPSQARNRALAIATGDWISILDADDEMRPERLSRLVTAADAHRCEIAFDNQQIIADVDDRHGPKVLAFDYKDGLSVDVATFLSLSETRAGSLSIGYAKPVFAASHLKRHGLSYDERFSIGEDWKFFLTALAFGGRCVYVDEPTYLYYRPATSLTRSGRNNFQILLDMTLACQKDLASRLQPQEKIAIRSLCRYLRQKALERTLRNTAGALNAAVRPRRTPS